jgi:sodium transport system permease protein
MTIRPAPVWTILVKELRETVRDRRTLMLMVGLPVLLYPLMIIGLSRLQEAQSEASEARRSVVAVWGELPGSLRTALASDTSLTLMDGLGMTDTVRQGLETGALSPAPAILIPREERPRGRRGGAVVEEREAPNPVLDGARTLVTSRRVDGVLVAWPGLADAVAQDREGTLSVYFDSVRDDSRLARQRLADALSVFRTALLHERETANGLPQGFVSGVDVRSRDVAPPARQAGFMLGMFLPFLLISLSVFGGFYPAVDLTAGEKERGTMQTLLCAPIGPHEIVAGKFLAVWVISLVTALANLTSLTITVARILPSGQIRLEAGTIVLAVIMLVPITLTTAALFLAVAAFARDFKDGQNFLTPVYMLLVLPAGATMLPAIELNAWTAFVPIVNIALLLKGLLISEARMELVFLTLLSSTVFAVLSILLAVRVFQREQVLLGGRESARAVLGLERRGGGLPTPTVALVTFAVALVVAFYASLLLESSGIITAVLVTQYGFFLLPAVVVLLGLGYDLRRTLSLRWPSWPATLASVLLGLSAWVLVSGLVVRLMPPPDSLVKTMERFLLLGEARQPLWVVWLALAVTPALCEETFFRGLMLGGLRSVGKYTAMAVSALAFGLAHASIYRLLPTFLLGLILAYVVWKSGSIVCAMIVHALNNGLIAMISREPALATRLGLEGAGFSAGLLATATLLAAVGFWILARMPEPGGTSRPVTR